MVYVKERCGDRVILERSTMLCLSSEAIIKQIPKLLRPGLNMAGKFPTWVSHQESLESMVNETKPMAKFQLKKVLWMGVAFRNCSMKEKKIFQNVQLSVNFFVSLLKKNWQSNGHVLRGKK